MDTDKKERFHVWVAPKPCLCPPESVFIRVPPWLATALNAECGVRNVLEALARAFPGSALRAPRSATAGS